LEGEAKKQRTCVSCKTEKPFSEFYANSKGQRRRECKTCCQAKERARKRRSSSHISERQKKWRLDCRGAALVNVAKWRAKTKGMEFDIEADDIQKRIDAGQCELTGIPFSLSEPRSWNAPSLDRIDPDGGYTKGNVRVVLYALNVMANTWGPGKILEIASAISRKRREASDSLSLRIGEKLMNLCGSGSIEYAQTWKRKATPSGSPYSEHIPPKPRTSGSGCTGWPTPDKSQGDRRESKDLTATVRPSGAKKQLTPNDAAQLAGRATPTTNAKAQPSDTERGLETLAGQAAALCGTTGATPSPSTAATGSGGACRLNPHFSLWLMGFPIAWGCSGERVTRSACKRRRCSSGRSSKRKAA